MKFCLKLVACVLLSALLFTFVSCDEHEHSFGAWSVVVGATCDTDGRKTRSCACGETEDEVIAAGHTYGEWTVLTAATCEGEGESTRHCTVCEAEERETIDPLGHVCAAFTYNRNATATKDGTASGQCSNCGETVRKTVVGSAAAMAAAFQGKTVSILGDSISTYLNVSNGDAADTTNSTIRDGVLYYDQQKIDYMGVTRDTTWWQRTADALGASVLVNNSWSGSFIKDTSSHAVPALGAYLSRAEQLHDDTGDNAGQTPDIIFVYMGTNDYYKYKGACGSLTSDDYASIPDKLGSDYVARSVAEAYAIMLYKISAKYPNAQIYCLNILEGPSTDAQSLGTFNNMIKEVAEVYGAVYVDICADSGIRNDASYQTYIPSDDGDGTPNGLHPNAVGMEKIADCLLRTLYETCSYMPDVSSLIE